MVVIIKMEYIKWLVESFVMLVAINKKNKNMFRHVTLLGLPRSVYKATLKALSCNSESKWPQYPEGHGQAPHFQYQPSSESQDAHLVIVAQIHYKLTCGQAEFPRILSQNGQNDLEGQG